MALFDGTGAQMRGVDAPLCSGRGGGRAEPFSIPSLGG